MKKAKVLSILLAAIMIFAMLPQCALAAADAAALDTALGNLADKGQKYVTDGALTSSVEIDGEAYTVTYASTKEAVITSTGTVNHGLTAEYVTVTPQITVAGSTVKGTAQKLIVLPDPSLANATFFEDFEGSEFAPAEGAEFNALSGTTTYGKWTTSAVNSNSEIHIKTDSTKYLKLRMATPGTTNGTHIAPFITAALDEKVMTSDMTVVSLRMKNYIGSGTDVQGISPFFNIKRGAIYQNIFHAGVTNSQTTPLGMGGDNVWHDVTAVRVKGATANDTVTEVFVNGSSVGSFNGEISPANTLKIEITRAKENPLCVDDIYAVGLDLPEVKLADKGQKYVTADTLPESAAGYPLTYECSDPTVITTEGEVNKGINPEFVTVTPKLNVGGSVITLAAQELVVMPSGTVKVSEDFEGDAFKPETGATEKVLSAGTHNGWTVTTADGNIVKTVDDATRSRYLNMYINDYTKSASPSIKKAMTAVPDSGVSILAFSANYTMVRNTATNRMEMRPFAGIYTNFSWASSNPMYDYTISKDGQLGATADDSTNGIYVDLSAAQWNDYIFVRKNSATAANVVTDVYMDGRKIGQFTGDGGFAKDALEFFMTYGRATNGNTMSIDNIIAMDVAVDVKVADKGNTFVTVDNLPTSISVGATSASVTYTSSDATVIASNGAVTHGKEMKRVTVTPTITVDGITLTGTTQTVLVTPAGTDEIFFEDFETFTAGTLVDHTATGNTTHQNGWTTPKFTTEATISIDTDAAHGKFANIDIITATAGNGVNPTLKKTYERNGDMLLVSFRACSGHNARYYSAPQGIQFGNLHVSKDGIDGITSEFRLTPGQWYDICYTVDYTDSILDGDITKYATTVYVDGALIGTGYYDVTDDFRVYPFRNKNSDYYAKFDDVYVATVDPSDYIVSSVDTTNTALKGFNILSKAAEPVAAKAYAAFYDAAGNLTNVHVANVNGDTTVSGISKDFGKAEKMNIFVWSQAALQPLSIGYERILRSANPTIHVFGDSIVAKYEPDRYPEHAGRGGWGQYLEGYLEGTATVINRAVSGKRADTFVTEGYYGNAKLSYKQGDILLVKFGNNDHSYNVPINTYKEYLAKYINEARAKGVYPVLVTPSRRNQWNSENELKDDTNSVGVAFSTYIAAINEVAAAKEVPVIDLYSITTTQYEAEGQTACEAYFYDGQHLTIEGAQMMAQIVVDEIKKSNLYIAERLLAD